MTGTATRSGIPARPPAGRAELEAERDHLLDSLADLEAEHAAGELDDEAFRTLHDDYTARAAAVLRTLEAADGDASGAPRSGGTPEPRPGARRRTAVTLAVIAVLAVTAVGSVVAFTGERQRGQPVSGSLPDTGSAPAAAASPVARALERERAGDAVGALELYDAALEANPDDAEALAYRGWLLKRAGLIDEALASLDRAVAVRPDYPDAHFFRGMVLYQDRGDPAGAVAELRLFLAADPPAAMVPMVEGVLRRAERDAGLAPPTTG